MDEININTEIVSEICGYIRAGAELDVAILAAGIKYTDMEKIVSNLKNASDEVWLEFLDDIRKAQAQFEVMQLMKINADGGSKGSQWLLERATMRNLKKQTENDARKKENIETKINKTNLKEWSCDIEGLQIKQLTPWDDNNQ